MKMSSKVVLISLLALAMLLSACQAPTPPPVPTQPAAAAPATQAPASPNAVSKTFTVGYSAAGLIDDLQIGWSESVKKTIEAAGGKVIIVDSQNKIEKQVADIEDLLTQKIDFLVVNPVDEAGIVPAIEAANKANVPVVTIDRKAGGGDVAAHVGFDNYKAGYDAGQYCAEKMGGKGDVAQLEGQAGTSVARERAQGFNDAIAKYPDMKVVFDKPTDWDTTQALAATEDMLSADPNVKCIWAHADAIIMGAVQALDKAGKLDQVITIGMGMYGGGPESIKAGQLTASWELYSDQLGQIAGQAVVDMHNGKTVEKAISTNMTFVTKDNIDQFLQPATSTPVAANPQPFTVGYSAAGLIDDLQIGWSESVKKTIEAAGGKVIIVDSQNKIEKRVADIEDLLTQKIDFLVVNPVDEAGIVPAIEAANKANVPVVTIDRKAGGGDVAAHVGFDNYKAGYDAGQYCAEKMGGKGDVAQLEGQAGTSVARERAQGFNDAIAKYPDMKVVFDKPTDWDTTQALAATEDMLSADPNVKCIWAHADAIIMGAVQALDKAGKLDQVITIGMGMYGGGPESIKAGQLTASWELYSDQLGQIAGQAVVDMHNGKTVEKAISTDMTFVTKDNIDQFLQ